MQIKHGAQVVDSGGQILGAIDYVVNDSWSGEVARFGIHRKGERALFFTPADVAEATDTQVKLKVRVD